MTRGEFLIYGAATALLAARSYLKRMDPYRQLDSAPAAYPEAANLVRPITVLEPPNGLFLQNPDNGRLYKAGVNKETFADMLYLLAANVDPKPLGRVDQETSISNLMRFVNQVGLLLILSDVSSMGGLVLASYDDLGNGGPKLTILKEAFRIQFQLDLYQQPSTEIFAHELIHLWQDANFPNLMVGWRHIGVLGIAEMGFAGAKIAKEVCRRTPLQTEIEYLSQENRLAAAALKTITYGVPTMISAGIGILSYYSYSPLENHARREAPRIARLWEEQFPGRQLLTLDPV